MLSADAGRSARTQPASERDTGQTPKPNAPMSDSILGTRTLTAGATFHRCALQVNPHHYAGTYRGSESEGDPDTYAQAVVDKAIALGISVLAITDHNDVSGVPAFQDAAQGGGVTVFPGFELSSGEGIHVLCIYAPETTSEELTRFLGEFGIRTTKPSTDLSTCSFVTVLEKVRAQGGLAIAAHASNERGLFRTLTGRARINAWTDPHLVAIQIPGPITDLPDDMRRIVENKESAYARPHPAGKDLAVAVVNAKDVVSPEILEDPSATCQIKMSEVTIEGLRQAFLDPLSRIRLNSESTPDQHAELLELTWEGGFLDGVTLHFNPNLNVLVGGRGAGKSTVIESLRYVLGLTPVADETSHAHTGIVQHVLKSGTKISVCVRIPRPAPRMYRIERTVPNSPIVRDHEGKVSNLKPEHILSRVDVYGQHEVSELAARGERLTQFLERFVERDPALDEQKAVVARDLAKTRRSLNDVRQERESIDERLAGLPSMEEELQRFRDAGFESRLYEQSQLLREEDILDSIPERLNALREALDLLRSAHPVDQTFLSAKALESLPGGAILSEANPIVDDLNSEIAKVIRQIDGALRQVDRRLDELSSRWYQRRDEVQAAYQKTLRDLQESAVDGEEFIRLGREVERLRPLRERRSLLQRIEGEHQTRRTELLDEWERVTTREFTSLDEAARRISEKLKNRVQVTVTAGGDRRPLLDLIEKEVGGRLSETKDALLSAHDFSLPVFVAKCREGADALEAKYGIPARQAKRLANASHDILMRIQELTLPPTTSIELNTALPGESPSWHTLAKLSTGQRATAVLLLLLLHSEGPLIVDQPEDDLDNRFITEWIVPRMRTAKQRRQFVFSTHNANIPVLGDAEQIFGLTASRKRAQVSPEHMGAIDKSSVRELVEEVLEGGKDAFELRRRKYGF